MGRDPTDADLYFLHQQGPAGGRDLLRAAESNPNRPANEVVRPYYRNDAIARRAIMRNVPQAYRGHGMPTAGQMWRDRYINIQVAGHADGGSVDRAMNVAQTYLK